MILCASVTLCEILFGQYSSTAILGFSVFRVFSDSTITSRKYAKTNEYLFVCFVYFVVLQLPRTAVDSRLRGSVPTASLPRARGSPMSEVRRLKSFHATPANRIPEDPPCSTGRIVISFPCSAGRRIWLRELAGGTCGRTVVGRGVPPSRKENDLKGKRK